MKLFVTLIFGFMVMNGFSLAQEEPQDFRGLKWGATIQEFKNLFPGTSRLKTDEYGDRVETQMLLGSKIGTVNVEIAFVFLDNRFSYAYVYFKSKDFKILEAAFKERYGPPHSEDLTPIKTRAGVEYTNKELKWTWTKIRIWLRE